MRSMRKALLYALLCPNEHLAALQQEGKLTEVLVLQEELKTMPFGAVWDQSAKLRRAGAQCMV